MREKYVFEIGQKSTKNMPKLEIQDIWRNFGMKTLFLLSYFIYLFNVE
jgi:hypothetical protein